MPPEPTRETDLFPPIRDFLEARGYAVRAEVHHCDVTATRGDDLIVIELKRRLDLTLLIQAARRQRITDSVYVAVPRPENMGRRTRWPDLKRLLRRLELGLILVALDVDPPRVEVAFHPMPCQRRKRKRARRAVLREMAGRTGGQNLGGASRRKLVTAYRERAIHAACLLERFGPCAPRRLRALGAHEKVGALLYANHYGWFDRLAIGLYALTPAGRAALDAYPDLAAQYRDMAQKAEEG